MRAEHLHLRFWRNVNKDGAVPAHVPDVGPCWLWTAGRNSNGYGWVKCGSRPQLAHRAAWFLEHGYWPDLCVLHKCDNPLCVRMSHLFLGTKAENNLDKMQKGRFISKLSDGQAIEIATRKCSGESNASMVEAFWVSPACISTVGRTTWLHLGIVAPLRRKLTEEQAREIVRRKAAGESCRFLAREYGVSHVQISNVGRTQWRRVEAGL